MAPANPGDEDGVLPNFCGLTAVFAVVVSAELLAFLLALLGGFAHFWADLARLSLFLQWTGLMAAAALCLLHRPLTRCSELTATWLAYAVVLAVVAAVSAATVAVAAFVHLPLALEPAAFLLRNLLMGALVAAFALRYLYVQHQWKRRLRAESEARLQALQARIRPHFLFNSMNTIASLIASRPEAAEDAVEDLADLFRASLGDERRLVPLADEVELVRRYLRIEAERLGGRLQVEWALEGLPEGVRVPPLTLQPLVENAVYHGIEPSPQGGTLRIRGERQAGRAVLCVDNPLPPDGSPPRAGNRLALDNIRERLVAHFGAAASLETAETDGRFRVTLRVPVGGAAA